MKRVVLLLAFVVFSFVIVDNAPAPPPPPGLSAAPTGGAIPSSVAIAAIAAYGVWRMRGK